MAYSMTTSGIKVTAEPQFLPEETDAEAHRYFWAYTIAIVNLRPDTVELLTRHWEIINAHGTVQTVDGDGVVGEQPVLKAGESFEYTSGCPLGTPSGIMRGHYVMQTGTGERFTVAIPAFSLDMPGAGQRIN